MVKEINSLQESEGKVCVAFLQASNISSFKRARLYILSIKSKVHWSYVGKTTLFILQNKQSKTFMFQKQLSVGANQSAFWWRPLIPWRNWLHWETSKTISYLSLYINYHAERLSNNCVFERYDYLICWMIIQNSKGILKMAFRSSKTHKHAQHILNSFNF